MADLTKRIIFIVLYWISALKCTSAFYCEWGICTQDEICCGTNKCCPKSNFGKELLYMVAWILLGLLVLVFLYIFLRNRITFSRSFFRSVRDSVKTPILTPDQRLV